MIFASLIAVTRFFARLYIVISTSCTVCLTIEACLYHAPVLVSRPRDEEVWALCTACFLSH